MFLCRPRFPTAAADVLKKTIWKGPPAIDRRPFLVPKLFYHFRLFPSYKKRRALRYGKTARKVTG